MQSDDLKSDIQDKDKDEVFEHGQSTKTTQISANLNKTAKDSQRHAFPTNPYLFPVFHKK